MTKDEVTVYIKMSDTDIGRLASGGYGAEKKRKFIEDFRHMVALALGTTK